MSISEDFQVGQQVVVEVECVFDEGLVVCYRSATDGFVARGAMLFIATTPHPALGFKEVNRKGVCGKNLESLTVDLPKCLVSGWKPYSVYQHPNRNLLAIGERKKQLVQQILERGSGKGRFSKWRAGEHRQPLVVESSVESGRLSKILASQKIKRCQRSVQLPRVPIQRCSMPKHKPASPTEGEKKGVSRRLDMSLLPKGMQKPLGRRVISLKKCSVDITRLKVRTSAELEARASSHDEGWLKSSKGDESEASSEEGSSDEDGSWTSSEGSYLNVESCPEEGNNVSPSAEVKTSSEEGSNGGSFGSDESSLEEKCGSLSQEGDDRSSSAEGMSDKRNRASSEEGSDGSSLEVEYNTPPSSSQVHCTTPSGSSSLPPNFLSPLVSNSPPHHDVMSVHASIGTPTLSCPYCSCPVPNTPSRLRGLSSNSLSPLQCSCPKATPSRNRLSLRATTPPANQVSSTPSLLSQTAPGTSCEFQTMLADHPYSRARNRAPIALSSSILTDEASNSRVVRVRSKTRLRTSFYHATSHVDVATSQTNDRLSGRAKADMSFPSHVEHSPALSHQTRLSRSMVRQTSEAECGNSLSLSDPRNSALGDGEAVPTLAAGCCGNRSPSPQVEYIYISSDDD